MKLQNTKKIITVIAVLLVICIWTIIKAPYLDKNFTGEHSMKYSAYVGPAIHMVEEKNPFAYKQIYSSNPIEQNQGERDNLPTFPIIEWKLASMMSVFPNLTVEQNTRIFMHTIGVLILIFSFLFIKEWTNKTTGLIAILLLATNPIFNLSTFVTVYDSVILAFFFISLYLLTIYIKRRKPIYLLALSGVFAGIGIAAKITLLLWIFPIVIIILLFKSPNLYTKIFDIFTFLLFMSIPYVSAKYTIPTMPQSPIQNLTILLIIVLFSIFLIKVLQIKKDFLIKFLENLQKKKILIPILIILTLPTILISTSLLYSPNLTEEFLTDSKIFFNFDMYFSIFKQFVRHLGITIGVLSLAGLITTIFLKLKDLKILVFSFLISSIFFVLSSSKAIFFHDYYTVFLMFVAILFASVFLNFLIKRFKNFYLHFLILILVFFFVSFPRISHTQERLGYQEDGFDDALEYFIENTQENDFYIDEVQATYFSLYSKRPRVDSLTMLEDEVFKESVRDIGFGSTMEKYNIKYLITFSDEPSYEKFANVFSDFDLKKPVYRRSDLILSIVNPNEYKYFEDFEERNKIIERYNVKEKFVFEKEVGNFRFFRFVD